jgi:hypothetical protein
MSCSRCPEHPDRRSAICEVHGVHRHEGSCRRQQHAAQTSQARRLAMMLAPAKPAPLSGPPILTLVRPRRRLTSAPTAEHLEPARAAAVKDGRHISREACSPLPGRSLTAASTAAQLGGSGPEGATHTSLAAQAAPSIRAPIGAARVGMCGCLTSVRSPFPMRDRCCTPAVGRARTLRARRR